MPSISTPSTTRPRSKTAAGVCVAALGIGITPIARVTSHDPHDATRILDCGAQGSWCRTSRMPPRRERLSKPVSMRPRVTADRIRDLREINLRQAAIPRGAIGRRRVVPPRIWPVTCGAQNYRAIGRPAPRREGQLATKWPRMLDIDSQCQTVKRLQYNSDAMTARPLVTMAAAGRLA
jgi:hypothetical protein